MTETPTGPFTEDNTTTSAGTDDLGTSAAEITPEVVLAAQAVGAPSTVRRTVRKTTTPRKTAVRKTTTAPRRTTRTPAATPESGAATPDSPLDGPSASPSPARRPVARKRPAPPATPISDVITPLSNDVEEHASQLKVLGRAVLRAEKRLNKIEADIAAAAAAPAKKADKKADAKKAEKKADAKKADKKAAAKKADKKAAAKKKDDKAKDKKKAKKK